MKSSCRFSYLFWRFWKAASGFLSLRAFLFAAYPEQTSAYGASVPTVDTNVIKSFSRFRELSVGEASQGRAVRFKGVALCYSVTILPGANSTFTMGVKRSGSVRSRSQTNSSADNLSR